MHQFYSLHARRPKVGHLQDVYLLYLQCDNSGKILPSKDAKLKIYQGLQDFANISNPILTIGTFDGVHLGHRSILERLKEIAKQENGETVLLTFYPHPRMVLFPTDHGLQLLSTQKEKAALLEEAGIDHLIIHPFDEKFSRSSATEYVRDLLVNGIGVHTVVVGYDHHFGRNREGNFETLKEFADMYGFGLEEIPAQDISEIKVSSTKVRRAIEAGNIDLANTYLTRPYEFSGVVQRGEGLGKKIDFPTANIEVDEDYKMVPGNGVYAVNCILGDKKLQGMLNIGQRPTVSNGLKRTIEVNLFDFDAEISS